MAEFKTSFVGEPTSFSSIGASIGKSVADPIREILASKKAKKEERDKQLGIGDAYNQVPPQGIHESMKIIVSTSLEEYRAAETDYKKNGSVENADKVLRAKEQYTAMKNAGIGKTKFILETGPSILSASDGIDGGIAQQNIDAWNQYTSAPEGIRVVNGEVQIQSGDTYTPALNSEFFTKPFNLLADPSQTYGSTSSETADIIWTTQLASMSFSEKQNYNGVLIDKGVDLPLLNKSFNKQFNAQLVNNKEVFQSIALESYKINYKSGADLTEEDIPKAMSIFGDSPELKNMDGYGIFEISDISELGEDGTVSIDFTVTEDELAAIVRDAAKDGKDVDLKRVKEARESVAEYYSNGLVEIHGKIPKPNEKSIAAQKAAIDKNIAESKKNKELDSNPSEKSFPQVVLLDGDGSGAAASVQLDQNYSDPVEIGSKAFRIQEVKFGIDGNVMEFRAAELDYGGLDLEGLSADGLEALMASAKRKDRVIKASDPEFKTILNNLMGQPSKNNGVYSPSYIISNGGKLVSGHLNNSLYDVGPSQPEDADGQVDLTDPSKH